MNRKLFSVLVCFTLLFTSLACQLLSGPNLPTAPTATIVGAASTSAVEPTAAVDTAATTQAAEQNSKATEEAQAQAEAAAATQEAADKATEQAANRLARTATAVGQATAQASDMYSLVEKLKSDGIVQNTGGNYYTLEDFKESLAQINYYKPWLTGRSPSNFVIRAHTAWESASRTANWFNSGCGFVFRYMDGDNHYMIYLALDGNVYMSGYVEGKYREFGKGYVGKLDYMKGSADIVLVADGDHFIYYVNGNKVFDRKNSELTQGDLATTLVSGTNKDFGTRCEITNMEVWELGE